MEKLKALNIDKIRLTQKKGSHNRIVSTAQYGAKINKNFEKNIENLAKLLNVEKIDIIVEKPNHKTQFPDQELAKELRDTEKYNLVFGDNPYKIINTKSSVPVNRNLEIYKTQIKPQNKRPDQGYEELMRNDKSYIINSTKKMLQVWPYVNGSPRLVLGTGAYTEPHYLETMARGQKAEMAHTIGVAIGKNITDKNFIPYPLYANRSGNFTYENLKFFNGKVYKGGTDMYVLGDVHLAVVDKKALTESIKRIEILKPKGVVLHDLFDGLSINHHDRDHKNWRRLIKLYDEGHLNFEKEINDIYLFLERMSRKFPKTTFYIVADNHSNNILEYTNKHRYVSEFWNAKYGLNLNSVMLKNKKYENDKLPIMAAIDALGKDKLKKLLRRKVKFLTNTDILKSHGVNFSFHGDKGINGARGSGKAFNKNNLKAFIGHSHTPEILENVLTVGHLTDLSKQVYAHGGASSWLQANGIMFSDGTIGMDILENNFTKESLGLFKNKK